MADPPRAERWQRIEALYHGALDLPDAARARFLGDACGPDVPLREEVEALLAVASAADGAFDRTGAPSSSVAVVASLVGREIGPYRVIALLGAGGMGEVYRARDPRLGRDVALKVLPAAFAADRERLRRFEQEARAAAALNHPNIVTIHSVEEVDGLRFLTMELVDGQPLRDLIRPGGLPLVRLLGVAIPLADALAAAHGKGITHRDLKPANVMVGADNRVKILDFGLAKLHEPEGGASALPTEDVTGEGRIVGTVAYMSPEQAEGKPIDPRSDLFSLGVILYEMATGRRPFTGETSVAIISSILKDTPPSITDLKATLPRELGRIIQHALTKDPERRYQTAKDLRNDLAELQHAIEAGNLAVASTRTAPHVSLPGGPQVASSDAHVMVALVKRHRFASGLLGIIVIGALAGAVALSRRINPASTVGSDAFPNLEIQPLTLTGDASFGAISPDGKFVAYVRKKAGVWVRQISVENDIQVAPFVPDRTYDSVTITPDGNSVDFGVSSGAGGHNRELWRVPLLGGPSRRVVSDIWSAPGWSPDGHRMALLRTTGPTEATSVILANEDGTHERILATRRPPLDFLNTYDSDWAMNRPDWSPDGKRLILAGNSSAPQRVGSSSELVILDAATGAEGRPLPVANEGIAWEAAWLDDRHVLLNSSISRNSLAGLWSVDLASAKWTPLTRQFTFFHGVSLTSDRRSSVATRTDRRSGIWLGSGTGEEGSLVVPESALAPGTPVVDSAGGVLYEAYTGNGSLKLYRLGPGASKSTVLGDSGGGYSTTADGRVVVFSDSPESPLYRVNADGTGLLKLVDRNALDPTITPDGKTVIFSPHFSAGLYSVPLVGGPVREMSKLYVFGSQAISPDGRRLLFASSKVGRFILCDLPDCTNSTELELQGARNAPQWAPDGQGVAFINEQDRGNLWEQRLDGGPSHALTHFRVDPQILEFAWSPDGKHLALARGRGSDDIVLLKGLQ
jgi:serine/threonine protein kinase/Tol biopolymer transport system component